MLLFSSRVVWRFALLAIGFALFTVCSTVQRLKAQVTVRPNVFIAISDDQSYPHASCYGEPEIETPGFDSVAKRGILFHNAFTPCPGCSPMRAALLTGRHIWQNREAGTHASSFPKDLPTFTGALSEAGYAVGYTGKPWGPGNFKASGWSENPVGPGFNNRKMKSPQGISANDYAGNFEDFLNQTGEEPFCFWYGGHEPHRSFGKGNGAATGLDPDKIRVPGFLPDSPEVRGDLADYFAEIQWFDQHLARMLNSMQKRGLLDNTIVIVTSDNGMAFPRAKANLYEFGIHMPLAISWPAGTKAAGRDEHRLVSLLDVTATIYDVCLQSSQSPQLSGTSLKDLLGNQPIHQRDAVFSGRERHSSSRYNSLGYPCRCVRTEQYLYIRNFAPERWPAGTPQKYASARYDAAGKLTTAELGPEHGGYHDIDACPSLSWMIQKRESPLVAPLFSAAVDRRPGEELYDILADPACLKNLVGDEKYAEQLQMHRQILQDELTATGDLRLLAPEQAHIWENYPRYSSLRWFPTPDWATDSQHSLPSQPWLEKRRPREPTQK